MPDIYAIKTTFAATLDGVPHIFRRGCLVREGHEVFRVYRDFLEPVKVAYEYEAPKPESKPEPKKPEPKPEPLKLPEAKKATPAPAKAAAAPPKPQPRTDG